MKKPVKNILFTVVIVFGLVFPLLGCGTLETLINKDGSTTSIGDLIGGAVNNNNNISGISAPTASSGPTSADRIKVALYFADSSGKYLVEEDRTVPKTVSLARETVNQWLKGPDVSGSSLQALVPSATRLLDINIKDDIATVDLSKEFLQPNANVTSEAALYGLVDTLTQFATVKEVRIRVEGKPLTAYGKLDATHLVNKADLVKTVSSNKYPDSSNSTNSTNFNSSTGSNDTVNSQSTGTGNTSSGSTPGKSTKTSQPKPSPSSINLFDYPPSST